jgi:hypothetical protein
MIRDCRALSSRTDGRDLVIAFEGDVPAVGRAQLLLDAGGRLVGVDLGGGGLDRVAIMIGAHEDVASQRETTVSVESGRLRVHGGADLVIASSSG